MNPSISDPRTIVVVALALVLGWFALGIITNLRRGNAVLKWLQGGLPLLGEKTTFRWLGSSVVQMEIARAKQPFRSVQLMIVLAPRDVPWLWLVAAARGRRDILILRSRLEATPACDLELVDPGSWTGRTALNDASEKGWVRATVGAYALCAPEGSAEEAKRALPALLSALAPATPAVVRLGLRSDQQELEAHLPLPRPGRDARAYFRALQALARAAAHPDAQAARSDPSSASPTSSRGPGRARGRRANTAGTP